mmetsp:Transcript_15302/g.24940  ORF Transcript_15302/g.24940 Transcript_15302/m.24940 type:complete len:191 (+) Transcript_15302:3-575(+)
MEVEWYCQNYSMMTGQAAMLAGFAFTQLSTPVPSDHPPPFLVEFWYLFLTCSSIGLELSAIVLSAFLSVWGPSLALRGKKGTDDLHRAVECLRDYQDLIFFYFLVGWVLFFFSSILQVWVYFKRKVALVVTFPMMGFVVAIFWYIYSLSSKLRVTEEDVVVGKIDAISPYENIGDLDQSLRQAAAKTPLD